MSTGQVSDRFQCLAGHLPRRYPSDATIRKDLQMIRDAYAAVVEEKGLIRDSAQLRVVAALQDLQTRVCHSQAPSTRLARLLRLARDENRGLYLWGSVGRGKTFLMDLFYQSLPISKKRRIHFHRLMSEIHATLKQLKQEEDPLDIVAAGIAEDTHVLCLDEFFVSDIGDAMILAKLLQGLIRREVVLVTTSNLPPSELYRDGLQRDRFLPAIDLLEKHTDVLHMDGDDDYRLRLMQAAGTYLHPPDAEACQRIQRFFDDIAAGRETRGGSIEILGRAVPTVRCAKGIVWFRFAEICGGPRSQQDYIEIARWYQTVIVSEIPQLTKASEDAARRFIALVDEFYDRRVKLIVTAAAPLADLYQGQRLSFEFARTVSRLSEMQSREYLHAPHLA